VLRDGRTIRLLDAPGLVSEAYVVEYVTETASPSAEVEEARTLAALFSEQADKARVHRLAMRPFRFRRGPHLRDGKLLLWSSSSTTVWFHRAADGRWREGDAGTRSKDTAPGAH
jgi:hypothetical protein